MTARTPFVAGNWKMNGGLVANESLLADLVATLGDLPVRAGAADATNPPGASGRGLEVAVCPPFPYLSQVAARLSGGAIGWGAQDVSEHDAGAYTGEVAAPMLAELGCRWGIVGHSERRTLHGETDDQVARKAARLLAAGVRTIVCVGETLAQREADETEAVLGRQLDAVMKVLAGAGALPVVAYEPVWAIGTGRTATPEMAQQAHAFLRARLAAGGADAAGIRLLYGGSVKPGNAAELFAQPDIDGGLIGGAALVAADFAAICRAAAGD